MEGVKGVGLAGWTSGQYWIVRRASRLADYRAVFFEVSSWVKSVSFHYTYERMIAFQIFSSRVGGTVLSESFSSMFRLRSILSIESSTSVAGPFPGGTYCGRRPIQLVSRSSSSLILRVTLVVVSLKTSPESGSYGIVMIALWKWLL